MGAQVMDGGSYYQSSEGPVDASEELRNRFKLQKAGEPNEEVAREAVSSDWILGLASDRDARARHLSNGDLADDRDNKHIQSENPHGLPVKMENVAENHAEVSGSSEFKSSEVERLPTCVECGKAFPSLKALYGHLRCHPHRGYRGANRPPPESKNKLQEGFDSSSDRVLPAANWSVTAKRGRKRIIKSQDPDANAAGILLLLSRAYRGRAGSTPTPSRKTDPCRKNESMLDAMKVEMHSVNTDGNEGEYTNEMEVDDDGNVEASSRQLAVVEIKTKKKKKKIKHLDSVHEASPPPPTRDRRYRCSTCDKTFSTHQALGGHRASHNKNKSSSEEVVVMDHEAEDDDPAHTEELVDSNGAAPRPAAATAEHRCTICQATFRTGQALGGHKRRHWNGPVVNHHPPRPSPVPSSESLKKANNGLLDFDLNELPKPEAE